MSQAPGYTLFLTATEAVFDVAGSGEGEGEAGDGQVIRMAFDGGAPAPALDTSDRRPGVTNYLSGNDPTKWVRNVPSFGRVTYRDVYPGIDLVFRGNDQDELEYDFVVAPGADPSAIRLRFSGQNGLSVSGDGGLVLATSAGSLQQHAPVVYQEAQDGRDAVDAAFAVEGDGVKFRLGDYDRSRPLVIDPVIAYSTYLGGSNEDEASAIAVDSSGSAYVSGQTCSTDFPVAPEGRASPPPNAGGCDAFVAKLSPDGSELVYATYLGGNPPAEMPKPTPTGTAPTDNSQHRYEYHDPGSVGATGISIDSAGNAYVSGYTYAGDFPITANAFDRTCGPAGWQDPCQTYSHTIYDGESGAKTSRATTHVYWVPDAFLAKLDSTGSELTYASYFGGGGTNPPTRNSVGAQLDATWPGTIGTPPQYPVGMDVPTSVTVDGVGGAYVAGYTASPNGSADGTSGKFPITANARDSTCGCIGVPDAFLTHIDTTKAANDSLVYSSYLGGQGADQANSVAWDADPTGATVVVAGSTTSTDFPVLGGLPQGPGSGFVARFATRAATGAESMPRSTYFGSTGMKVSPQGQPQGEPVAGVAVGPRGSVYLTGHTISPTAHSATRASSLIAPKQPSYAGNGDAYVAKLVPDLSAVEYFTYLGGSGPDAGYAIAVDAAGQAHVSGATRSSTDFPLENAFQDKMVPATVSNGFVTKLEDDASEFLYSSYLGGSSAVSVESRITQESAQGIAMGPGNHAFVAGRTPDRDFPTSVNSLQSEGLYVDAFVTRISPEITATPVVDTINPKRGPTLGGTNVTIEGENFTGTTRVLFGEVEAHGFSVVNGLDGAKDRITVTSPMQIAEKVVITVVNASGPSVGLSNAVTFSYDEGVTIPTNSPGGYLSAPGGGLMIRLDRPDCQGPILPTDYPCGRVLIVMAVRESGTSAGTVLHSRLYNPATGTWSPRHCNFGPACPAPAPHSPYDNYATRTLLADGRVMFTGSSTDAYSNAVAIYDPTKGLWQDAAPLLSGRDRHRATLLSDGRVLITGQGPVEVYDPSFRNPATDSVGASALTGQLRDKRQEHTATLLGGPECESSAPPDYCGRVLVVGGTKNTEDGEAVLGEEGVVASVEVYDPATGTWLEEITNSFSRAGHSDFVTPDGKVWISGGHRNDFHKYVDGNPVNQVELYDPSVSDPSKRWTLGVSTPPQFGALKALGSGKLITSGPGEERLVLAPGIDPPHWRAAGKGLGQYLLSGGGEFFRADRRICEWRCGNLLGVYLNRAELYIPAPTVTGFSPAAAQAGGEITVTGTGFTPGSRVLFGGQEATATVDDYGVLRAVVPAIGSRRDTRIMVVSAGGPAESVDSFRYAGAPGSASPLTAAPTTDKLQLRFRAAGSVADANPPATAYQLRRARTPITTAAEFDAADALRCPGATGAVDCLLEPTNVGDQLSVVIDPPPAGSVRWYAVRAVSDDGQVGPLTATRYGPDVDVNRDEVIDEVTTVTTPTSQACPPVAPPAPDQVAYAAGYSLVGLPAGTVVSAKSPLYSWLNLGAGGNYATSASSAPTEAGRGYWAWFACPSLVQLPGSGTDSATLALGAYRASMVGNPSAVPARVTGHDFAARWDPGLNGGAGGYHMSGYRQAQDLAVGEGIWAFSYVPTDLAIQPR